MRSTNRPLTDPAPGAPLAGTLGVRLVLPRRWRGAIAQAAVAGYPRECCGLLIGAHHRETTVVARLAAAENVVAEAPERRFELDPLALLSAEKEARAEHLEVVGFWHSHPDRPALPSGPDIEGAWAQYSYVIVAVSARGAGPLRSWRFDGRRFREEAVVEEPAL